MTNIVKALEFGFGFMLVIVVGVLIIWGIDAISKTNSKVVSGIMVGIMVAFGVFGAVMIVIFVIVMFGGPISVPSSLPPASGTSHVAQSPTSPPSPNYGLDRFDEWNAAKHFIQAQYPGAQTFSSCDDSTVQASPQGDCIVKIDVGGVNAFNAPIRDSMTVFMKFQEGKFGLQRIDSQNDATLVLQQIKDGY